VVTFVVEAYLSSSRRLLWRATEQSRSTAYWLALRAEADPRLDVKVVEIREAPTELRPLSVGASRATGASRSRRPKPWLACLSDDGDALPEA
jgi:hypothetical protein